MQGQFSGRRQDYRMAPLPKRGFKQPALYRGKKPRTPSRNSISPITQPPPGPPPRNSDPAASNIDLLLGRSYPNDAGSEDGCYSDDEIEDDDTDVKAYDAGPYEGIESIPSITDYRLGREASAKFIRSRLGLDDMDFMWVGKKLLGQGNFGAAGLWEKYDMEGNVVDQLVVKEMISRGRWKPNMPKEVKIMKETNKTDCPSIVKFRSYRRYPHQQIHRIYMEYCPYGDLKRLYKRYRRFRRHFPEPFIWEVFYHMIEAASSMLNGPKQPNPSGHPRWDFEIVHRDIKPGNIFLGKEDLNGLAFYPTPKMGDFGSAVKTNSEDSSNPRRLRNWGTPKYMAPEQLESNMSRYFPIIDSPLSWYTNVWAIGACIFELITLHSARFFILPGAGSEGIPEIRTSRDPDYSLELRNLVRMCLRASRPTLSELLTRIDAARTLCREYAQTIRGPDKSTPHPDFERLFYLGNEIEQMHTGTWEPGSQAFLKDPNKYESEFRDPSAPSIKFPDWQYYSTVNTEDAYDIDMMPEGAFRDGSNERVNVKGDENSDDEMEPEDEDSVLGEDADNE